VVVTANGENVYPDDVERLVGNVEHIEEYAFLGIGGPGGSGERLACIFVPTEDEAITRAERNERATKSMRAALAKLPYHMQPGALQQWDAKLPRTATRKVKRNEVRETLERLLAARETASGGVKNQNPVRLAIASVRALKLEDIHSTSTMQGDLAFDSLSLTELLAALETRYGHLDPVALQACLTVADVEKLVDVQAVASMRPPKAPSRYQIQGTRAEDDSSKIVLPETLQERGKQLIGLVQDAFYGNLMKSTVTGRAHVPHNRSVIVVANHQSHLDMGFVRHALGKFGEDVVSLAASDYFFEREKWKRAFFENFTNLRSLDRKGGLRAAERMAAEVIQSGRTMLIFPEGTRSQDGQVHDFKPLVGHLALQYHVDILPLYIGGASEAMPKGSKLPKKRELSARIGPVFTVADMKRLTAHLGKGDGTREVARLCRLAIVALRDGSAIDFARATPEQFQDAPPEVHPLVALFSELEKKYDAERVKKPVSYYFTLGSDELAKWTVSVGTTSVEIRQGKPAGGSADCVLKTSPELFSRIVREAYTPSPAEFMSGAIKSNDLELLVEFQRLFQLA
jgi:long-chain acyl-CoA synthetase